MTSTIEYIELNLWENVTAAVEWHGRMEWGYVSKKKLKAHHSEL